jgi:hypothetical protein
MEELFNDRQAADPFDDRVCLCGRTAKKAPAIIPFFKVSSMI